MKHLEKYYAGKGCKCEARSSYECGCHDVDWTPKAVYELRAERDEARAMSDERYGYWQDAIKEYEDMRSKWREVTKERDEAREQRDAWERVALREASKNGLALFKGGVK